MRGQADVEQHPGETDEGAVNGVALANPQVDLIVLRR